MLLLESKLCIVIFFIINIIGSNISIYTKNNFNNYSF